MISGTKPVPDTGQVALSQSQVRAQAQTGPTEETPRRELKTEYASAQEEKASTQPLYCMRQCVVLCHEEVTLKLWNECCIQADHLKPNQEEASVQDRFRDISQGQRYLKSGSFSTQQELCPWQGKVTSEAREIATLDSLVKP